jgi:hypothetical protein
MTFRGMPRLRLDCLLTVKENEQPTLELLVDGTPKAQHISAVIGDLEGPESIARTTEFSRQIVQLARAGLPAD